MQHTTSQKCLAVTRGSAQRERVDVAAAVNFRVPLSLPPLRSSPRTRLVTSSTVHTTSMPTLRHAQPSLYPSSPPTASSRPVTPSHRAQESTSTTSSGSALSFTLSSRYASTCYTSDEGGDDEWDAESKHGDSFDLGHFYSPERSSSQVQHTLHHDEEDHYDATEALRSSLSSRASSRPSRVASTEQPSRAQRNARMHTDLDTLLASLQSTSLSTCFCGNQPEEDSIYCSRTCAQADALQALNGGGGLAEGAGDADSVRSGSTGTSSSHYRRVEREERAVREEEARRKREEAKERTGQWTSRLGGRSSNGSNKMSTRPLPPRTSSKRAPKSNSSTPSLTSSLSSATSSSSSAFSATEEHRTHPHLFIDAPSSPSPQPSPSGIDAEATPRAGFARSTSRRALTDDEYGVAPAPPPSSSSQVGLGYMSMMLASEEEDEEEDRVGSWGGGQRGKELKERVVRGRGGHKRGKLSFDDVMGIMSS